VIGLGTKGIEGGATSKFMVRPHGQEGWASEDILRTRREGVNFLRFCVDASFDWIQIWPVDIKIWPVDIFGVFDEAEFKFDLLTSKFVYFRKKTVINNFRFESLFWKSWKKM